METNNLILRLENFFKEAVSAFGLEMVFLYGSFACGYPHSYSDIDLGIVFSDQIKPKEIYSLITEITYKLTQKLNKEVNIISIDQDFSHPMLYYNAIVSGIPIFIKDNDKFLNLKLEAVHQMEDFKLFGIPWQREVAQKIMKEVFHARI